jgi:hypothetical protein
LITEPTPTLLPATIAQLTERFEDAPVFADITEAPDHETMQPRQDYLPMTLPEPTERTMANVDNNLLAMRAWELSLNPLAQGPDPPVLPPLHPLPDPPQVHMADQVDMKGKLNGTPPTIFDGDCTKAQDFMREFNLYWMQNDQHPMMTIPYYRMTTCLAHIRGPKVND